MPFIAGIYVDNDIGGNCHANASIATCAKPAAARNILNLVMVFSHDVNAACSGSELGVIAHGGIGIKVEEVDRN